MTNDRDHFITSEFHQARRHWIQFARLCRRSRDEIVDVLISQALEDIHGNHISHSDRRECWVDLIRDGCMDVDNFFFTKNSLNLSARHDVALCDGSWTEAVLPSNSEESWNNCLVSFPQATTASL